MSWRAPLACVEATHCVRVLYRRRLRGNRCRRTARRGIHLRPRATGGRPHVCATRESRGSSRAFGACSRRRRRPFICPGVRCLCHRSWGGIAHRPLSGGRCRHGGRAKSKKPRRNQESGESGHRERGQHGRSPPCLIHRRPCALDLAACICRRALRGQPGGIREHRPTHRLAWPAGVQR
ncbi:MAG: hypothetical protein E6K34_16560 [Gammaproteobacteria bacterium]|nr:MAG: hypothetical protein E6K34_16560 [Gammaproteobacteria bacterium]TLZ46028.1 MAG: hypothetical protein E6K21_17515 [Gammaproteobacteria bacterium]